jgi:hypothetical protein
MIQGRREKTSNSAVNASWDARVVKGKGNQRAKAAKKREEESAIT